MWRGHLTKSRGAEFAPVFLPYFVVWTMMLGVDLFTLVRRGKLGTTRFRLSSIGQHEVQMHGCAEGSRMGAARHFGRWSGTPLLQASDQG